MMYEILAQDQPIVYGDTGKIFTCSSQQPLAAKVFLLDPDTGNPIWRTTSKPDGTFDIRGLPDMVYVPIAILNDNSNADAARPRRPKLL